MNSQNRFPVIADHENVVETRPVMDLYDETDLISNIRGNYQDRFFDGPVSTDLPTKDDPIQHGPSERDLLPPLFEVKPSPYSRKERLAKPMVKSDVRGEALPKTQGQLAREQAREDIKRKKTASYLKNDKPHPAKVIQKERSVDQPQKLSQKLADLANRLRQENYILADLPPVYSLKKEDREREIGRPRNSYDFLRKSQVYNYPERKFQKERRMAQELNLIHMEEEI
ncbi:hypothetical protein HO675_06945 [Streptococcus suis]|nr:hypothetical protein [Streptococcus suis]